MASGKEERSSPWGRGREWLFSQAGQVGWHTREDLKEAAKGQSLLCRTDSKSWSAGQVGSRVHGRHSSDRTGAQRFGLHRLATVTEAGRGGGWGGSGAGSDPKGSGSLS